MALTEKSMLPACNDLWVLLSLSRVQLERLRPLLDAQSDECPARQPQVTEPLTSAQPGRQRRTHRQNADGETG